MITQLDTRKNTLPTSMIMKVVDNLHFMSMMLISCFCPSSGLVPGLIPSQVWSLVRGLFQDLVLGLVQGLVQGRVWGPGCSMVHGLFPGLI